MAQSRFPKVRRVGELRRLDQEIAAWESAYHAAAQEAGPEWLQGRFMDRARILASARGHLRDLVADLVVLPRLA